MNRLGRIPGGVEPLYESALKAIVPTYRASSANERHGNDDANDNYQYGRKNDSFLTHLTLRITCAVRRLVHPFVIGRIIQNMESLV